MASLCNLVNLAKLFQLCEWILLRSTHIVLQIFHPSSVVLLYNLIHEIWTGNQRVAERRTTGTLKDAVSSPEESIVVGQAERFPRSWA